MDSIQKTLQFIVDNWSQIVIILTLLLTIILRTKKFIEDWKNKTEEEKQQMKRELTDTMGYDP